MHKYYQADVGWILTIEYQKFTIWMLNYTVYLTIKIGEATSVFSLPGLLVLVLCSYNISSEIPIYINMKYK